MRPECCNGLAGGQESSYADHLEGGLDGDLTEKLLKGQEQAEKEAAGKIKETTAEPEATVYTENNTNANSYDYASYYAAAGYYNLSYNHQYFPQYENQTSQAGSEPNDTLYVRVRLPVLSAVCKPSNAVHAQYLYSLLYFHLLRKRSRC